MNFKSFHLVESELSYRFVRSSGAGGQNVNKVATKAILTWCIERSNSVPSAVKERFKKKFKTRINDVGFITLYCQVTRSQNQNKRIVTERLLSMIESVWVAPKVRRKTNVPKRSNEKRLKEKKVRSSRIQARNPGDSL